MKNWTTHEKPEFLDVAFSAERSVQDQLEEESKSEFLTIALSYLIMFLYVSLALGHVRNCATVLVSTSVYYSFQAQCFTRKGLYFKTIFILKPKKYEIRTPDSMLNVNNKVILT